MAVLARPLDSVKLLDDPPDTLVVTAPDKESPEANITLDCRVLLAEDGPDNQRLIAVLLEKTGGKTCRG